LLVGLLAGVAGTLGEFTAYWLGYGGERFIRFQDHRQYKVAERWMGRYGGLTVAFFALVPLFMFDFVGLAAGALRYPFKKFLIFCLIGRVPRCLIEAYVGQWILDDIMPHLPHWIHEPFIG
jgi:membrane protein YqaA with SNARE-associated domain